MYSYHSTHFSEVLQYSDDLDRVMKLLARSTDIGRVRTSGSPMRDVSRRGVVANSASPFFTPPLSGRSKQLHGKVHFSRPRKCLPRRFGGYSGAGCELQGVPWSRSTSNEQTPSELDKALSASEDFINPSCQIGGMLRCHGAAATVATASHAQCFKWGVCDNKGPQIYIQIKKYLYTYIYIYIVPQVVGSPFN